MKLDLIQRDCGVELRVQAVPGARRNAILGIRNGALRAAVTQVAEKGKANKALIDVLAKQLGLRKSQITLMSGETSPQKQYFVDSITVSELRERVDQQLNPGES